MGPGTIVLGTRGSALALRQANLVKHHLESIGYRVDLKEIRTTGDRILDVPLSQIGDKALFTKELDNALLEGSIHIAVHSLKDLPTLLPAGIRIAAVTSREDPRDAFVARVGFEGGISDLPEGATLATSSLRRSAQLKSWRSDLEIISIRGNVDSRINKLDSSGWHGIILASAGLNRLGLQARITTMIPTDIMLPAVGQGALAVVCAEEDESTYALLRESLHDQNTSAATMSERSFLRRLEGGCSVPVGACAIGHQDRQLELEGCVAALDGVPLLRGRLRGSVDEAEEIGRALAEKLIDDGAGEILDAIRRNQ